MFGPENVSEAQGSNVTSEESRSPPRWRGKKNRRRESRLLLSRIYFESTSVNSFNERLKSLRLYSVHSETRATLSLSPPSPFSHGVQNFVSRTALCVPRLSLFNTWCRITEPRFPKRFQRGSCPRIYGIKIRSVITFRRKSEAGLLMGGDKEENERYEIGRGGLASLEISDKPISRNNEDRAPRLF